MNDLDSRLSAWNPVRTEDMLDAAASTEAARLLQHVLYQPVIKPSKRGSSRMRWPVLASIATAAVVAVAVQWPTTPHVGKSHTATPDLRLVDFSAGHGYVTALITDPYAAASQLTAVFRAHGLNIQVQTVPVSPSLVGTFIYTDAPAVRTLWKPGCSLDGCPVGLVIPASFTGQASVAVGRPAKPGDGYQATADAFAPGEALHCSGLLGRPASAAQPVLKKLGLRASWWQPTDANWPIPSKGRLIAGQRKERRPVGYIIEGDPLSATTVALDTLPTLPANHEFRELVSQWNRGCQ